MCNLGQENINELFAKKKIGVASLGRISNGIFTKDPTLKPITQGSHPWNLHPTRKGETRECPKCWGQEIKDNKCIKCGYTPLQ